MNFTLATIEEITHAGYVRGRNIAAAQDRHEIGDTFKSTQGTHACTLDDEDEIDDALIEDSYSAEENNRQYTPFEFTAKEINDRPDSEEAWDAFSSGIDKGIADEVAARRAATTAQKEGV